jgi:hypothetical protein
MGALMGSLALLIVYTLLIGLLELQFNFTVGQIVERIIRLLTGQP